MAGRSRSQKPRVMRVGKTERDRASGAWVHHQQNQRARRLESSGTVPVPQRERRP